jgi:hypothetical protein
MDFWLLAGGTIASRYPSPLHGMTPAEALQSKETRRLLRSIPAERCSEDLRSAVANALLDYSVRTAPLLPLPESQCLGWLDEHSHLLCRLSMDSAFTRGSSYPINCGEISARRLTTKTTIQGTKAEVAITGSELLVTIRDEQGRDHSFYNGGNSGAADPFAHSLETLIEHFQIPLVPDITQILPARFRKNKKSLANL